MTVLKVCPGADNCTGGTSDVVPGRYGSICPHSKPHLCRRDDTYEPGKDLVTRFCIPCEGVYGIHGACEPVTKPKEQHGLRS